MTDALHLSSRIYDRLLAFYPEDLRRDYGEEMALVFAEELRDSDFGGSLRIWRKALTEFLRFALPDCVARPAFRAPAIALAFALVTLGAASAMHAAPIPVRAFCAAILPTSNLPIIALVCMWVCRGRGVTSLHLSHGAPEEQ